MEINYNYCCVGRSVEVDGEYCNELPLEKKREVLNKILDKLTKEKADDILFDIIIRLTEEYGEESDGYTCDCCGDWNCTYTLEI